MLRVVKFRADSGFKLSDHSHEDWHVCVVLDGAFCERVERSELVCEPGSVRLSRPGALHEIEFARSGGECLLIEAAGPFWNRILARPLKVGGQHVFGNSPINALAAIDVDEREKAPKELSWMTGILLAIHGAPETETAWTEEARWQIESRPDRSLEAIARSFGVNREAFARIFRQTYGYRPQEHRMLLRVHTAMERLRFTDQRLAELAMDCGFTDQSHMTNVFRVVAGVTPASLRESA